MVGFLDHGNHHLCMCACLLACMPAFCPIRLLMFVCMFGFYDDNCCDKQRNQHEMTCWPILREYEYSESFACNLGSLCARTDKTLSSSSRGTRTERCEVKMAQGSCSSRQAACAWQHHGPETCAIFCRLSSTEVMRRQSHARGGRSERHYPSTVYESRATATRRSRWGARLAPACRSAGRTCLEQLAPQACASRDLPH